MRGSSETKGQFLRRRLGQEEAAATQAADERARESHLELARRYRNACGDAPPGDDAFKSAD